jgi:CheY-like chemotaxis protein/MinD-like ATPase involved in chromosome partitioning or flagellar assembly
MAQTILIIDDDIDTLKLVGIMLERKGFRILASTTGEKGLQLANKEYPDLVLLDVMIPDINGYEIARSIRTNPATENTPIIMFTARSQVDDKVEGLEAGADAYITKPARPRELFAQVNSVLKRTPQHSSAPTAVVVDKGTLIGIISAKGGIGNSTLATNLAIEIYNQSGEETILADFRPGQGTIGMDLDIQNTNGLIKLLDEEPGTDISDLFPDVFMEHKSGIKTLLSSHHPSDSKYITHVEQFFQIAKKLPNLATYTILDLGPSLTPINAQILPECDKILICLEPSPSNVTQTRILIQDLINSGIGDGRFITVLVNRQRSGVQLSREETENQLERKIDQTFTPAPELAYQAAAKNIPIIQRPEESMTKEQFRDLAKLILD